MNAASHTRLGAIAVSFSRAARRFGLRSVASLPPPPRGEVDAMPSDAIRGQCGGWGAKRTRPPPEIASRFRPPLKGEVGVCAGSEGTSFVFHAFLNGSALPL